MKTVNIWNITNPLSVKHHSENYGGYLTHHFQISFQIVKEKTALNLQFFLLH